MKLKYIASTAIALCGLGVACHAGMDSTADLDWSLIDVLIQQEPGGYIEQQKDPSLSRQVMAWREVTNRLLRDAGLRFYDTYPDDQRRWMWLWATIHRPVDYLTNVTVGKLQPVDQGAMLVDTGARSAWEKRLPELKQAFLASPKSSAEQRCLLRTEDIDAEIRPFELGHDGSQFDWSAEGAKIAAIGREFPNADVGVLRSVTGSVIRSAKKWSPDKWETISAELEANPNQSVRSVARKDSVIARARTTPIEMHFTAMDGREVDLAKLRGKVVMIDFRGITWCGACRSEEGAVKTVYDKYHDQGFEIICITHEAKQSDRARIAKYIAEKGMPWPHYFDGKANANPYIREFGITAVPEHFILDKNGLLVEEWNLGPTPEGKLEALVRKHLGLEPTAAFAVPKAGD